MGILSFCPLLASFLSFLSFLTFFSPSSHLLLPFLTLLLLNPLSASPIAP
jgi:multisubunit Na+/H+ antiporter MnhG subunit